jgi:hypothetical protein
VVIAGHLAGGDDGSLPELGVGVGVESVDASVLGGYEEDIVQRTADVRLAR